MYASMMGGMSTPADDSVSGRAYGYTQARESLKVILDSRARGEFSTISRPDRAAGTVVIGESMRSFLSLTVAPNVQLINEDGAWAVLRPGQPFAVEATELAADDHLTAWLTRSMT